MNIVIFGAAGFIGTNLAIKLAENKNNSILLVDKSRVFFTTIISMNLVNVQIKEMNYEKETEFSGILEGQDIVFHLASTTVPSTSNQHIPQELMANVIVTSKMLENCVKCKIKKVIFLSSGGTVYGKEGVCPLKESTATNPISSYGIQKITIEKLLYLYHYLYGLDYRIIRLANPYGPYQRPNGILGAVTTFTYKAIKKEKIIVFGDGSIIRDYIYIDDAVKAILKIAMGDKEYRVFNLGCGYGTSINELLEIIKNTLKVNLNIIHKPNRIVDVPINYLDISRYEESYGKLTPIPLNEGIYRTAKFLEQHY